VDLLHRTGPPRRRVERLKEGYERSSRKTTRHELIERLPDVHIATAVRFLEFMLLDPVARAVATARLTMNP
jgi:hypothetical protein